MDARTRGELVNALRRKRAALLKEFLDAEADLRSIAEEREAELEERAQGQSAVRILSLLNDRSLREMQEIHVALQRMIDGTYGKGPDCGRPIPLTRLRAVPTALFCVECAREAEGTGIEAPATAEPRHPGRLPPRPRAAPLDREVEEVLRALVRRDARVDLVRPARSEPVVTEAIIESTEHGLDYVPPDRPPLKEE